ncbi:MAG: hypothetical protein HC939_17750 [Pleurocapsa sp. SU_5_0]|nr:hypothetical protein [Pleurocapsa sp. SU_5_0]
MTSSRHQLLSQYGAGFQYPIVQYNGRLTELLDIGDRLSLDMAIASNWLF